MSLEARTVLAKGTETNFCVMRNYKTIDLCTVFRILDLKQKLETLVEGHEGISNPNLRPLNNLSRFMSSLFSFMSYLEL